MDTHHSVTALSLWEEMLSGDGGPAAPSQPPFPTAKMSSEKFLRNCTDGKGKHPEPVPLPSAGLEVPRADSPLPAAAPFRKHLAKWRAAEPAWLLGSSEVGCWEQGRSLWPCWGPWLPQPERGGVGPGAAASSTRRA